MLRAARSSRSWAFLGAGVRTLAPLPARTAIKSLARATRVGTSASSGRWFQSSAAWQQGGGGGQPLGSIFANQEGEGAFAVVLATWAAGTHARLSTRVRTFAAPTPPRLGVDTTRPSLLSPQPGFPGSHSNLASAPRIPRTLYFILDSAYFSTSARTHSRPHLLSVPPSGFPHPLSLFSFKKERPWRGTRPT